ELLEADVMLDGTEYTAAGIRLKGNSSLKGVPTSAKPETLPWLVRLDKFVDGVNHGGLTELVVRSNSTTTALNEAVALDLLAASGLASQQSASLRFSVNGSSDVLRLAVENPADAWVARVFTTTGLLYKAEAGGDYSYRGTNATAYEEIFDIEAGDADLGPLIDFLDFVNNSSDADFVSGLGSRLDVDAFARYLAFEELIDNFDDIDGPGNNSYLWWNRGTQAMTVVAWDHNLAFGARPGAGEGQVGMAARPGGESGVVPSGRPTGARPEGMPQAGQGTKGSQPNALVSRFTSLADGTSKVADAKTVLKARLFSGNAAEESLRTRSSLIEAEASDLVSADALASEKQALTKYFA
ncbi:MAG TPA: CotH kinase family protein, partial [Propionibacteriaceae bacterium]|nr:CotH kinase family protein [Propionibacteriaceae bacterium]